MGVDETLPITYKNATCVAQTTTKHVLSCCTLFNNLTAHCPILMTSTLPRNKVSCILATRDEGKWENI